MRKVTNKWSQRLVLLGMFLLHQGLLAWTITVDEHDAVIWARTQTIKGDIDTNMVKTGTLRVAETEYSFTTGVEGEFQVDVILPPGLSQIYASIEIDGLAQISDTIRYTLGFDPKPEIHPELTLEGKLLTLCARTVENPLQEELDYGWSVDADNPLNLDLVILDDSTAQVTLPEDLPTGEYYFDLMVESTGGTTVNCRTMIRVGSEGVHLFDGQNDHAQWIDEAVIYGITPYIFVAEGRFSNITAKLPEIAELGVNTLWIQPVFDSQWGGQGYDIIDYFCIREDIGGEVQLRELVETAKSMGFRVLFDFVANHSSIYHPYAVHSSTYGDASHYYDYYQREADNSNYSQHYTYYQGFINYFWNDLPNLNYNNPEVRKWISEACLYWVRELDIDGYRFDAIWGVNARRPEFIQDLRLKLKRLKPELLLLGEDKASWPESFDHRFDVAYDWAASEGWVSQWVFQTDYQPSANPTVFNLQNESNRVSQLRQSLSNNGSGYVENAHILRMIENNDTHRFIRHHGLECTKMAAKLMFALNGVPLIYNGQEVGATTFPYNDFNIFTGHQRMDVLDTQGLMPFYRKLIQIRQDNPALRSTDYEEIEVSPSDYCFAFRRSSEDQNLSFIMNMRSNSCNAELDLGLDTLVTDSSTTYYLTDLYSGDVFAGNLANLNSTSIPMDGYGARLLSFADTAAVVLGTEASIQVPQDFKVGQNFPNPFNASTNIPIEVTKPGLVRVELFDLRGRLQYQKEIEVSVAGPQLIHMNAVELSSGTYLYRVNNGQLNVTRKMTVLK
ncbi:MAG: T9SS type A sorting domain-containing protein [Candidatus Marinimicrobia bacterium]|nr:T9SS type A sorting domain-containing protein [Candidatus Neomarinimicrobiota bacterium]MCF7850934.1 T9SS type A sorting domain-containing protein [Candidatus Neomarinimicrobiota bacterium]